MIISRFTKVHSSEYNYANYDSLLTNSRHDLLRRPQLKVCTCRTSDAQPTAFCINLSTLRYQVALVTNNNCSR